MRLRSLAILVSAGTLLAGCVGTQMGRSLFGTPSNNTIAAVQIFLQSPPSRAAGAGPQYLALTVNAYDRWGNLITVPYNGTITLSSTGSSCEIAFSLYQNAGGMPVPLLPTLAVNSPQPVAVTFNPSCGPNPVKITASTNGANNANLSF